MEQSCESPAASRKYPDMRLHEPELKLKYDLAIRFGGIACTAIFLAVLSLIIIFAFLK